MLLIVCFYFWWPLTNAISPQSLRLSWEQKRGATVSSDMSVIPAAQRGADAIKGFRKAEITANKFLVDFHGSCTFLYANKQIIVISTMLNKVFNF